MANTVIRAENLGKKYIIGHKGMSGYKTFREQMLQHGHNFYSRTKKMLTGQQVLDGNEVEEFWALKNLNFEIKQGDRIGIIGKNGAGKSTLLKILSRITEPTTGKVFIKGRIASLLEVGTGFHPELTGRENIFLNGAIMGMGRAEIKRKFDEIVDFSGVEKFLDTPVKRYSSGMYVRLAFSVAAHLEPEILVVDEVLAVGDAEFQKKCLGKMQDVSASEGRTVLFVSHNMPAIANLCNTAILLRGGEFIKMGNADDIIQDYMLSVSASISDIDSTIKVRSNKVKLLAINIQQNNINRADVDIAKPVSIEIVYEVLEDNTICTPSIVMKDNFDVEIFASFNSPSAASSLDKYYGVPLQRGTYNSSITIPANFLNDNTYFVDIYLSKLLQEIYTYAEKAVLFNGIDSGEMSKEYHNKWKGVVRPKFDWYTKNQTK
jgi:lipopolysaccharide transport system ATP-binding protein